MSTQTLKQATEDMFIFNNNTKKFNAYWAWCKASHVPCVSVSYNGKRKGYWLKVDTLSVPTTLSNNDNQLIYEAMSLYEHDLWSGPGLEVVIIGGLSANDAISLARVIVGLWITPRF